MNSLASRLTAALTLGQATRLLQIDTAWPADTLLVERATVSEAAHAGCPLLAKIDCVSTQADLPLKSLMGTAASLRLLCADGSRRTWRGWVAEAAQLGSDGGLGRYRLTLRDGSCWLSLRRDTRIFQDLTTADIVAQVISAWPQLPLRLELAEPGPLRAHTTQYRETDWAFACRLMAAEGWSWRLDHAAAEEGGPTLVVFDQHASRPDLGGLRFSQPGRHGAASGLSGVLGALAGDAFGGFSQDTLTAWATARHVGPNAITLAAWDERQLAGVGASARLADTPAGVPPLELYRGHGERQHAAGRVSDAQHGSPAVAEARTQALLDAHRLQQQRIQAQGAVRTLHEGATFELLDHSAHPTPGRERRFSVLSVTHDMANNLGAQAAAILRATDVEQGSYRNHFEAAPEALRLLPLPTDTAFGGFSGFGGFFTPTAPGPQTAVVMAPPGEPIHCDRDGRIRIQFAWQRGESPLAGGLTAPLTPTGAPTGHAPSDATSGTWVRVAQGVAGPGWGALFTPRPGTEVLVDFIDGDIDRPIIIGQLHNGPQPLPWPAGQDASANHPGTLSGWHHPHLDDQGANQWVIDDATGQLRMRLASHSSATGHSELTLGHLIQQGAHGGASQRGQWLGEGFYGHTEGWAVVRAGEGLLLSTSARPAQGASVVSTQMDAAEAVGQLQAARQLGEALGQSARQQGAHGLHSHDGGQAWQAHADAMDPRAQGRHDGAVGGQDARKARGGHGPGSRELAEPVERFAKPLLHLDTPASAVWVTPASISLFSGQDSSVAAQGDAHLTAAHSVSAVSGQTTSLYTHAGGIQAITANAALSLRAHTDAQQIWSEQDLTVQSTTDEVRIQASKSITLTAGQSQVVIEGGNITFTCPGTWTVKGATHDWSGGARQTADLVGLPDSRIKLFDRRVRLLNELTGEPMAGIPYQAITPEGDLLHGETDEDGFTEIISTPSAQAVQVKWGVPRPLVRE